MGRVLGLVALSSIVAVFAFAGCGGSKPSSATADVRRAPPALPSEGSVETPDHTQLHYLVRGSGPETIVVLHGGPGLSSAYLAPDLDDLARTHTVIYYDQRGCGRSTVVTDPERLTFDAHVEDVEAIRQHFKLERVVVLGHSWGAGLAAFYALKHPEHVSKLVLYEALPPRRDPFLAEFGKSLTAWMDDAAGARIGQLDAARKDPSVEPVAACRAFWKEFIRGYFFDAAAIARLKGDVCDIPAEALRNQSVVAGAALGPLQSWDWREQLHAIAVPTLIIAGAKSPIPMAGELEWQTAIPGAKLVTIENAGHFPHVEQPQAFRAALEPVPRSLTRTGDD